MPTSSYWPLPRSELYRWPGGGGGGGGAPKTQKRKNPKNAADTMSEATAIVSEAEEGSVLRRRVPAARTVAIDSGGSDTPPEDSSRGHQVFLEAPLPHTNTGLPTFVLGQLLSLDYQCADCLAPSQHRGRNVAVVQRLPWQLRGSVGAETARSVGSLRSDHTEDHTSNHNNGSSHGKTRPVT